MNREIDTYLYADNQSEEEPFVLYNEKTIKLFNFLYYITNIEEENCKQNFFIVDKGMESCFYRVSGVIYCFTFLYDIIIRDNG